MSEFQPQTSAIPPDVPPPGLAACMPAQNTELGFAKVMVIIDLVFCSIRLSLAFLSVVCQATIKPDNPIYEAVIFEAITGFAIAVIGIPAAILLLRRVRFGVMLGWLAVAAAAASIIVGIWQGMLIAGNMPEEAAKVGATIIVTIAVLFRIALLVMYGVAVGMYDKFLKETDRGDMQSGF